MSIEAMKQALEALEDATKHIFLGDKNGVEANIRAHKQCESLRQAIATTEESSAVQEPVAYLVRHFQGDEQAIKADSIVMPVFFKSPEHFTCEPLYTHPQPTVEQEPKREPREHREWVGLDNDDWIRIYNHADKSVGRGAELAEKILKEKNT